LIPIEKKRSPSGFTSQATLPSRTMLHRDTAAPALRAASEEPGWGMQPLNAVRVRSVRSEVIAGPRTLVPVDIA